MKYIPTIALLILITSCSPQPSRKVGDLVYAQDENYWEVVYSESFKDGGSVALGLINWNGEVIYLWADSTYDEPGKQKLFLQMNYNDPNRIEIFEDSRLERKILSILDDVSMRPYLDSHKVLVTDFIGVLNDRTKQVSRFWWKKAENKQNHH